MILVYPDMHSKALGGFLIFVSDLTIPSCLLSGLVPIMREVRHHKFACRAE